jgi:hypothetical protein
VSQDIQARVRELGRQFPKVDIEAVEGEEHLIFRVRKRTFAYYLVDHHGDGEIAVSCKAEPGMNTALVEADPERFYLPAYLHHRGWIAVRLDLAVTDWDELSDLVETSYRLVAPKVLVRQLDAAEYQDGLEM